MRIISDFQDYYDIGMQNGIDPQLPYRRFRREEAVHFYNPSDRRPWHQRFSPSNGYSKHFRFFYIGFAGKVWSCIDVFPNAAELSLYFDPNQIDDSFFIKAVENDYPSRQPKWLKQHWIKRLKDRITECFEHKTTPELLDLFEQFKTAIWVWRMGNSTIVINERLNLYSFQKILPPMQAFQELAMYVGSYLTKPVIEEPPISDQIKAEIKGFDKHSFRKEKQK